MATVPDRAPQTKPASLLEVESTPVATTPSSLDRPKSAGKDRGPTIGKITSLESLFATQTAIWLEHKNGPDGDALYRVLNAIIARQDYLRDKPEELAATDALIARRFTPRCQFDRTHDRLLFDLAVDPGRVSPFWKWRERLHRKFCYEHKGQS